MNMANIRFLSVNRINYLRSCHANKFFNQIVFLFVLGFLFFQTQMVFSQLPVDPAIIHGNASIDISGSHMSVTNTPGTVINWQDFSIGNSNSVYFQQQDVTSQILNRVTGNNISEIFGDLSSNGSIWLINPHGIIFGENARIDVGGLVTSTLNITDLDFLANNYRLGAVENTSGAVINHGEIRTSLGGRVWLVGNQVHNDGLIQSPRGEIVLVAGQQIELIDSGAPNLVVRIEASENNALNLGNLVSTDGKIDVLGSIVNVEGISRASSVINDTSGSIVLQSADTLALSRNSITQAGAGTIQLAADQVLHEGQVTAQAGRVGLKANDLTYMDGQIDVSVQNGKGGEILIETGKLEGMANAALLADGQQGGQIRIIGEDSVAFSSTLKAMGVDQGGKIEVSGDSVVLLNATIDASGDIQGGTVHLGGGWRGEGSLPHAREVIIGAGSDISANANNNGKGGEIAIWSTQNSEHYGVLQAQMGGRIELSSLGEIRQTGAVFVGPGGEILFDPKNIVIIDNPPDNLTLARKLASGTVDGAVDGDNFGTSMALSGDRLVVGASSDDSAGVDRGAVYLFTGVESNNFTGLTLQKKLTSNIGMPELQDFDFFGTSVALDGDRLAIGARGSVLSGDNHGAVHLFTGVGTNFSGVTWQKKIAANSGDFNMPILTSFDLFGTSLALDGDRLVVGAPGDSAAGGNRGAIHLFTGVGADFSGITWQKKFSSDGGMPTLADSDFFGWSLALDGDRLAVGAPGDSSAGDSRGAVYLYSGVGADFSGITWQKKLASGSGMPMLADSDSFGWSLALNGNLLAAGALSDGGSKTGAVHLFTDVGTNFSGLSWNRKIASGIGANDMPLLFNGDNFGRSIALENDRLAIGALSANGGANTVYFFNGLSGLDNATDNVMFSANPSGTSYIKPILIEELLDSGASVVLQANNDLSVQSPINANKSEGNSLTLQAGRNVSLNADIATAGGDFTAIAGDSLANAEFRDAGIPTLDIANGVSLDVDAGVATLAAVDGRFINNNGDQAIIIDDGGRWLIYAANPNTSVEGFTQTNHSRAFSQPFISGRIPDQASSGNWFFYSVKDGIDSRVSTGTVDALIQNLPAQHTTANSVPTKTSNEKVIDLTTSERSSSNEKVIGLTTSEQSFEDSTQVSSILKSESSVFGSMKLDSMSREEKLQLIAYREELKQNLFADAIYQLKLDPSLADVPICSQLTEKDTGTCRITERQRDEHKSKVARERARAKIKLANIPQIERKYVVLIGIDQYTDQSIPSLENAIFDAKTIGNMFAIQMGYEKLILSNATRTDIVRTLNNLSVEMEPHDSVVVYFAGHGYMLKETGHGYWIPADATASDPKTWISNKSISEMLASIQSNQIVVISDSCYSGVFASESGIESSETHVKPDQILRKRSILAMSSGGNEPVSDEGRDGHSIFAWYLMRVIQNVESWRTGINLFNEVKVRVSQSFPQTPQYGGIISAGYETGGDYLFEFRILEEAR